MAMPRSLMIRHAGLSEALTNIPSNFQHWYIRSSRPPVSDRHCKGKTLQSDSLP